MAPCPNCQAPNYSWAERCRICGQELPAGAEERKGVGAEGEGAAWAEAMRREVADWQREGLIGAELAHQLDERYSWTQVVLSEVARLEREGVIDAAAAEQLRRRYRPEVKAERPQEQQAPVAPPQVPVEEPVAVKPAEPLPPPAPPVVPVDRAPLTPPVVPEEAAAFVDTPDWQDPLDLLDVPTTSETPSSAPPVPGILNRLLQSFVEEANLHWLLYLGILLIVASSVFLVASQWSALPHLAQYVILLAYTSGFYVAAWFMLSRYDLRRTGHALLVVTTLLVPLNFWGMQGLGLFADPGGWLLAVPAALWLAVMTYLCASHVHRQVGRRFSLAFLPLAAAQAVVGFWGPPFLVALATLLVLEVVWHWTSRPEPPFADARDRHTTWAFLLGGLAYAALLVIGRVYVHNQLLPFDPITGPLLALWALAVLLVAQRFRPPDGPATALTGLHVLAYCLALFGIGLAARDRVQLWLAAAAALPVYIQAVRLHRRPLYLYLAALAIAIAYFFAPALFPVVAAAFRDQLATTMGYARMPIPFYGITLFPLALLGLFFGYLWRVAKEGEGEGYAILHRHALGLAIACAVGCLAIAWEEPPALACSLVLTTIFGYLLTRVLPHRWLAYFPAATGLLAVLALANLRISLYRGPDPISALQSGTWTGTGALVLAVLGLLWTAAGYRLWWSWQWTPPDQRSEPSRWLHPLLQVGITAAGAALPASDWQDLRVMGLAALVALAAAHVERLRIFVYGFLALTQAAIIGLVLRYLPDRTWPLCLLLLNALILTATVAIGSVLGRVQPPVSPMLALGKRLRAALDSRAWSEPDLTDDNGLWNGLRVSLVFYNALLLLFQVALLAAGMAYAWELGLHLSDRELFWALVTFLPAPLLQAAWLYILPAPAVAGALFGGLVALYSMLLSLAVPPIVISFATLGWAAVALAAARGWETLAAPYLRRLYLPEEPAWRMRSVRSAYQLVPWMLLLGLAATAGSLIVPTALALWLAAALAFAYGALNLPPFAIEPGGKRPTPRAADPAAYAGAVLLSLGCYWLLVHYAYLHRAGGSPADLVVVMAAIAVAFAYLWEGGARRVETGEGRAGIAAAVLAWRDRGVLHWLAVGHAVLAFLLLIEVMTVSTVNEPPVRTVLLGLAVLLALAVLTAGFAATAGRAGRPRGAAFWVYAAHLAVACVYVFMRLATPWLAGLDEYLPVVLVLGAFLLIGVRQIVEREQVTYAIQPVHVVSLIAAIGTIAVVGWQAFFSRLTLINPLSVWLVAVFFTQLAARARYRPFAYAAALLFNGGFYLLWWTLGLGDQQAYLIPAGILLLWFAQFHRRDLQPVTVNRLRLAGLLIIYGSSAFALLGGGVGTGLPALILLLTCVAGLLAGIALRIRAYLYLAVLFLLVDVTDQLVFFSTQFAPAKWIIGFSLGLLLVGLAVLFESRRDAVLARIKALTDELSRWD